jgi:hydrophobe/amphiphile efflux-1 (HAE1) family protein
MSRFFIERPVFAWVIAIVIMLAGALSILKLPVEQYPDIAPPQVSIRANYPGASAETIENSVTQVIEQRLTGIDHLRYFTANSDSSGTVTITLTFEPGTNPDIAQVQTQNKIQAAISQLPQDVQQQGVTAFKANNTFLLAAGFYSKDNSISREEIADILVSKVQDQIARIDGVGDITIFGDQHSMRIWLNPHQLLSYNLTVTDVQNAIKAQNTDVSAGQMGGLPAAPGQQLNATITAQSRLKTVADFKSIILRVNTDGSQVRVGDVARVEMGAQSYTRSIRYNRAPAAGIAISLATGANALKTADAVKAKIAQLKNVFPESVQVVYPYDTTPFVRLSIEEVIKTLFEAIILVFCVMYLFMQNFRATLIPTIAVPVVLLGTFAILSAFGFTINVLTMFAMVLAIGLLVDDAIVVVENVERIMQEEGLSPKKATIKSMEQITGALVGIAMVLSAVFVPMAFFSGSAGAIYRQFSLTIVSAMGLSVLVALVLSPSLCAIFLKPIDKDHGEITTGFFGWFNRNFNKGRDFYTESSSYIMQRAKRFMVIFLMLVGVMVFLFIKMPRSFLPDEDQGFMFVMINTPAGATMERTAESAKLVEDYFLDKEKDNVAAIFMSVGFSQAGSGQNVGFGFIKLKDWKERPKPEQRVQAISIRAMKVLSKIKDASAFAYYPPPIRALGNASGFDMQLVDRGGIGHTALMAARDQLIGMAAKDPQLTSVRPNGLSDVPQYRINVDHEKASAFGLSLSDVNQTLQTAWGSSYVNDFIDGARIKRVYLQADAPYRMMPDDVDEWYVRNNKGEMVPFSSFSAAEWTYGSPKLERFNGSSSVNIQGAPAPGISSGTAMDKMVDLVSKLPKGVGIEWSGISYEERLAGAQAPALYALSLIVVFLCLAALYESWTIPISVIMVVPLGIIGAVAAVLVRGLNNDVFFQVGLLTTIGLTAKNAILIVEFAKDVHEKEGTPLIEATMMAAKLRFRPILMTSMAFILGVLPLAISSGAGSASQNAIGTCVIGGMIAATFLAIFFVPMFFVTIHSYFTKKNPEHDEDHNHAMDHNGHAE